MPLMGLFCKIKVGLSMSAARPHGKIPYNISKLTDFSHNICAATKIIEPHDIVIR